MKSFTFEFNGRSDRDLGLYVTERPGIPAPAIRYESVTVPGRDGALYISDGEIEDVDIEVEFNFLSDRDEWQARFRSARKWLTGKGEMRLSDDGGYFRRVKKVEIETAERTARDIGRFKAKFTCDGYTYALSGKVSHGTEDVQYNPYSESCPVYEIAGEGSCTLTVNGNEMKADVSGNLTIDTELMISYRDDGGLVNTKVTGDYRKMRLVPGENEVSVTEGFTLKIIPNWRLL